MVRIIYVDDDEVLRELVSISLARNPRISIECASGGDEAIARMLATTFDIALLDIMMPGMSGPDILAAMRAEPKLAQIPVVFLTAGVMPPEVARLMSIGAHSIISKPFDVAKLAGTVLGIFESTSGPDDLEPLRTRFRARCATDLAVVMAAMRSSSPAGSADLRTIIHRLSGLAASFGFDQLGELAGAMDAHLVSGQDLSTDELSTLASALAAAVQTSGAATAKPPSLP